MRPFSFLLCSVSSAGLLAVSACGDGTIAPITDIGAADARADQTSDPTDTTHDTVPDTVPDTTSDTASDTPEGPSPAIVGVIQLAPASVDYDDPEPVLAVIDLDDFDVARDLSRLNVAATGLSLASPVALATDVVCPPALTCFWLDFAPATNPGPVDVMFTLGATAASYPLGLRTPARSLTSDRVGPLPLPELGRLEGTWSIDLDGDGHDEVLAFHVPQAALATASIAQIPRFTVLEPVADPAHPSGLRFDAGASWPAPAHANAAGTPHTLEARVLPAQSAGAGATLLSTWLADTDAADGTFVVGATRVTELGVQRVTRAQGRFDKVVTVIASEFARTTTAAEPVSRALVIANTGQPSTTNPLRAELVALVADGAPAVAPVPVPLSPSLVQAIVALRVDVAGEIAATANPATGGTNEVVTLDIALPPGLEVSDGVVCGETTHFRVLRVSGMIAGGAWVAMPSSCMAYPRLSDRISALSPSAVHARLQPTDWFDVQANGTTTTVGLSAIGAVVTLPEGRATAVYEIHGTYAGGAGGTTVPVMTYTLFEGIGAFGGWDVVKSMNFDPPDRAPVVCDQFDIAVSDADLGHVTMRVPGPGCGTGDVPLVLETRPNAARTVRHQDVRPPEGTGGTTAAIAGPGSVCGHYTQQVWATTSRVGCGRRIAADVPPADGSSLDGILSLRGGLAHVEPNPSADEPFFGALTAAGRDVFGVRTVADPSGGGWMVATVGGRALMRFPAGGVAPEGGLVKASPMETWLARVDANGDFVAAMRIDGHDAVVVPGDGSEGSPDAFVAYQAAPAAGSADDAEIEVVGVDVGLDLTTGSAVLVSATKGKGSTAFTSKGSVQEVGYWTRPAVSSPGGPRIIAADDVAKPNPKGLLVGRWTGDDTGRVLELGVVTTPSVGDGTFVSVEVPLPTAALPESDKFSGIETITLVADRADGTKDVVIVGGHGTAGTDAFAIQLNLDAFLANPDLTHVTVTTFPSPAGLGLLPLGAGRDAQGALAVHFAAVSADGTIQGGGHVPLEEGTDQLRTGGYHGTSRGINHWGDRQEGQRKARRTVSTDLNGDRLTDLVMMPEDGGGDATAGWPEILPGIGGGDLGLPERLPAAWHGAWVNTERAPLDGLVVHGSSRQLSLRFGGPGSAAPARADAPRQVTVVRNGF